MDRPIKYKKWVVKTLNQILEISIDNQQKLKHMAKIDERILSVVSKIDAATTREADIIRTQAAEILRLNSEGKSIEAAVGKLEESAVRMDAIGKDPENPVPTDTTGTGTTGADTTTGSGTGATGDVAPDSPAGASSGSAGTTNPDDLTVTEIAPS